MLSARPKIAFVHIPRTGGMTFGEILRTVYVGREICSFYGDETRSVANEKIQQFVSLDAAQKNSYAVLKGHVIFDFDKSLKGFHYVTLLREPLDRLVSYYFYALRQRHHYLHPWLLQRRIKLEQFLLSDLSIELDNYQVRAVSGAAFPAVRERVNQGHLDLAKQNLRERFASFGLSESFERSMLEFARVFGWSLPPFGHANRAEYVGKPDLSLRVRAEIACRNQFDLQLYEYAQGLFAARIDPPARISMARQ